MRVQTLSSLRNPGHLMRAGMNMFTTQVDSSRDYCGDITGQVIPTNYLLQQQQQLHHKQYSPESISYLRHNQIPTIRENEEFLIESTSLINPQDQSPYAGHTPSTELTNASGIGQLDTADNSVLLALNNFNQDRIDNEVLITSGQITGGISTFHGGNHDDNDELVNEPERLIMYGKQRSLC
jgi:hypothetical protein